LDQCRLDVWTARDGLPASDITSIAQTPDGFIWLATSAGLVQFDGSNFTVYNSHNTPGLTSDLVRALTVRNDGTLWIGTEWGGFGPFVNGKYSPLWPSVRHWHRVQALQEAPDGSMIVSVHDNNPENSGLYRVVDGRVVPPSMNRGYIQALAAASHGAASAAQSAKALIMEPLGVYSAFGFNPVFFGKSVTAAAIGHDGSVWFGTEHSGLIRLYKGHTTVYSVRDGLTSSHINCLFEDREGCLWIGTNDGIVKWDGKRFSSFGKIDGLYASNVKAISEDREGNLWVSSGFGLNRFAATKLVPFSLTRNSVVAGVYGISASPNSTVWCASDLGLWKLLPSGATLCTMPPGLPREYADGVCAGKDGNLYLWFKDATGISKLFIVAPPGQKTAGQAPRVVVDAGPAHTAARIPINISVSDAKGVTLFSGGVMTRVENGVVVSTAKVDTGFEFRAVEDRSGDYWVACTNGLVHIRKGVSTRMDAGLPPETHVLGIDTSDPSCLWLATDKGLARFRDGESTLFDGKAGLPDSNLFQILGDDSGALWIGCLHGVFMVRIADVEAYEQHHIRTIPCIDYSASDGIRSYFNLFSTVRTSDGKLWFCGENGVTMADPRHVAMNNFPPPVTIESAVMDRTSLLKARSIIAPPGDGRLHVNFAALSFAAPEQVRFRYRLEGFDNAWVESSRRFADYTNLPSGSYRFVVTACNNDGIWNPVGASISFKLAPHYYQTLWFRLLSSITLLALLGMAFAWRMRQVVRHNAALEKLIAERTAELRLSNDQLQAAQEELTAQNHELEAARDYLEQRVADRTCELENAYDRTIEGWSYVMDLRDKETEGHSRRVTDVTVRMAEAMGLTGDDLDNVRRGALLHDIGKMGIPDSVLLKPGPLTDEEWKVMRLHPVYAYEILLQIDYLKAAVDIPWCHHEKWDGTGYPRGLKGEDIPLSARMFSIVDVWDALRSDRPYRKGWPEEKVFDHLRSLAGTHFEPELVELFFNVMAEHRDRRGTAADNVEAKAA
jgi:putative nucleotidyltransferase with HDIG domain